MMHILYYLGSFPKLSESFVLNEIYELRKMGHDVTVFALNNPDEYTEHQEYNELDITVHYADIPSYANIFDLLSPKVINPSILQNVMFNASPRRHAAALHRSKQCIQFIDKLDLDIDLVHSHFATIRKFSGRYVASYYDVPFTVTAHASDLYDMPNKKQLRHILNKSDRVITISEYNKKYIRNEITENTPISVVHAGIRPEKFDPTRSTAETRILTVSRFVEKKGLPYAIESVSKIADQFPGLQYHIIGSGELKNEIKNQIRRYDLTDTIDLLNNVSDEKLIAEFDEATCFLLPCIISESGDRDGIPVALMESMAMKTPPISTNISGIPELIDDQQNGVLVEPKNTEELAEALSLLLTDNKKQLLFGEAARQKVKNEFNIEREASKLESVFADIVN